MRRLGRSARERVLQDPNDPRIRSVLDSLPADEKKEKEEEKKDGK